MLKYKRFSRPLALLLAAVLVLSASGCDGEGSDSEPGAGKWRDSDLVGSVKSDDTIRLQDDFAAAVNQEWISGAKDGDGAFQAAADEVLRKKQALLNDTSVSGRKAEQLRIYADLAADWDARNEDGAAPLADYISDIQGISTLEEMNDFFCSAKRNPFRLGVLMPTEVGFSLKDPTVYLAAITPPSYTLGSAESYFSFDDGAWQNKLKTSRLCEHILSKLNFKKEETEALLAAGWRMEKELAGIDSTLPESEQIRIMLSWDECVKAAGSFPLETILRSWGFNEKEHFYMDTGYAKKLGRIYTDGNLEDLKSMLVMQLVTASALYLDRETYDLTKELEKPRMFTMKEEPPRTEEYKNAGILFDEYIANSSVGPILDELYLRRYMKKKEARPLRRMVEDLKKHYEALFQEEEWLSEEGRAQCIEKLSAMKTHVVYPDFDMVDYSSLKLIPRDKGGTFFKAVCDSQQCTAAHNAYLAGVVNDREKWDPYIISTTVTNAFYMPNTNGIYILAGLLEDPIYRPDMSREELLGGIGAVVGHEITHGFDANGSLYNKDGLKESWMSSEDTTAFSDRTMKVSSYYSTIHPFSGAGSYDGSKVSAEATADMGGLRLTLAIAEDDPDFDYETFFRQYAAIWRTQNDEDVETSLINADEHPLAYLRINVGLQQFPKFYETFGVKEGDGMYLEESKRIAVW